jgi:hypothetical protein
MERELYLGILRRYWWLVVAVPLLTALIATAAALGRPPRYGATARLLITRDPSSPGAAGRTAAGEDTTAQDLPAILSSAAFRHDLAAELARRGQPIGEADLAGAISASTSEHAVAIVVASGQPGQATAIAQALIEVLRAGGMRYWGDASATPAQPGLLVGVLDPPGQAVRLDSLRSLALEIGLRTLASLGAAAGLAFVLYYIRRRSRR